MGNSPHKDLAPKFGGYSDQEINELKEFFQTKISTNGLLNKRQFMKLFESSTMEVDQFVGFFDMDKSGQVDEYKFLVGMSLLRQCSIYEKASVFFNLYNFDNSGSKTLGEDELQKLIYTLYNTQATFMNLSKMEEDELNQIVYEIVRKYDKNEDQELSLDEFKMWFSRDKQMIKFLRLIGVMCLEDLPEDVNDESDDDLSNELQVNQGDFDDERTMRIKSGIEHSFDMFDEDQQSSDDQLANKSLVKTDWRSACQQSQPTKFKRLKGASNPPNAELVLDHVHGYRCHDVRNNIHYSHHGKLVYHTAAVGIVLDQAQNKQTFFMEHSDDIICCDVYDEMAVTGQIGFNPMLSIWDLNDSQSVINIKGQLQKGIINCCFSWDGKYVAASCITEDHDIAVYDINALKESRLNPTSKKNPGLVAFSKATKAEIMDLRFTKDNKSLIACCNKQMIIFEINAATGNLQGTKVLWGKVQQQCVLGVAYLGEQNIVAMSKGQLCILNGRDLQIGVDKAHKGSINSLQSTKDFKQLFTAGNDGIVNVWGEGLKKLYSVTLTEKIQSLNPKIRSIAVMNENQFTIGTRGGEIIEFTNREPKMLNQGHYEGELWGMCTDSTQQVFYTVGEDKLVASWDIQTKIQLNKVHLKFPSKQIAVSPNSKYLAVGCLNGNLYILDSKTLKELKLLKHRKEVSVLKFSPNGDFLAVGIAPPVSNVVIYDVENWKVKGELKGNPSRVEFLDFSADSTTLQINNTTQDILYFNLADCKIDNRGASVNKNTEWASWTCHIGWPVQGIWPECSDGQDINTVDRNAKDKILVTGDDFGKIKLFKYPAAKKKSGFIKVGGHSAHVTQVRFSANNDYLISTGGGEKSIMQWKYINHTNPEDEPEEEQEEEEEPVEIKKPNAKEESLATLAAPGGGGDDDMFATEEVTEGDQRSAFDPFMQVKHVIPSDYKPTKADKMGPKAHLFMKYIHGYRCFDDCRETAKYLADGRVVFIEAAVGVVLDHKKKPYVQTFFTGHDDDIMCMAVHPKGLHVATGQVAHKGKAKNIDLHVWETENKESVCNMNQFHLRAINNISFSPDGTKVVSTGRDDDNSMAIHDWQSKSLIVTSNVDKAMVTGIAWVNDKEFVTVGVKHIKFWTLKGRNVSGKNGSLGGAKMEGFTRVTCVGGKTIAGTGKGNLMVFSGGSAQKPIQAHKGEIGGLLAQGADTLYSGGADGLVIKWNLKGNNLTKVSTFADMSTVSQYNPGIRSLDMKEDGTALIGTRGSEIYEKDGEKYTCLLQGHYEGELWGCAASPDKHLFATCGGDKTVRIWNSLTNKMESGTKPDEFKEDLRALDWSPNGEFLITCDLKGKAFLLSTKDSKVLSEHQCHYKSRKGTKVDPWVEEIKFSPDGSLVALGAHGGQPNIEILDVSDGKVKMKSVIKAALSSALVHLDWTLDGSAFMINTQDYFLRYYNVGTNKQDTNSKGYKDEEWASMTCKISWFSQGVFQNSDFTDINTVTRSHNKKYLVSGDDDGNVNLYNYPCPAPKSKHISFPGHSSHVTRTRFSFDDTFVYSTGGGDKSAIVWTTDFGAGVPEIKMEGGDETDDEEENSGEIKVKKKVSKSVKKDHDEGDNMFAAEALDKGDEFMAVKPWLGAIKEPTEVKKIPHGEKKPKCTIDLNYCYGYRVKDTRNNLRYITPTKIVYHAAAVGIVHDIESNTQQFFKSHTDDITALCMSNDKTMVATGEVGPQCLIAVWNPETLETIYEKKGVIKKGISALSFSESGKLLVAAAIDDDHMMCIINVKSGALQGKTFKGGRDLILDIQWSGETEFITVGPKHYKVWAASTQKGKNGSDIPKKSITCIEQNGKQYVIGVLDGNMEVRSGGSLSGKPYPMHKGGIDAILVNDKYVCTGGRDGIVKVLDNKKYGVLCQIDCNSLFVDSTNTQIRSLHFSEDNKKLLVGTYGSEIYELETSDDSISSSTQFTLKQKIMSGHYTPNKKWTNEAWGLEAYPKGQYFLTCSDDATLRKWDAKERKQVAIVQTQDDKNGKLVPRDKSTKDLQDQVKGRCVTISPDEKFIMVGFKDGTVRIYDGETLKQLKVLKVAKEWISDIKFSPDQSDMKVCIGSHDNALYIYSVPDFKKIHRMNKHSSYITHFDWSEDSNYLHSTCGAYELLFWDVCSGKQITRGATQLRDENWSTWTTVLGWPVQGVFQKEEDGTDVNYIDRSHNMHPDGYHIAARGDDNGKVGLFKYPSTCKNSELLEGSGHSSHVPCVKWSEDDQFLFSIGGEDQCAMQWIVKNK